MSRLVRSGHVECLIPPISPFSFKVAGLRTIYRLTHDVRPRVWALILLLSFSGGTSGETIFLEDGGVVSMEAENFTDRVDGNKHVWESVATADGISGSASEGLFVSAVPDIGANLTFDAMTTPYLDYAFRIVTPGTYFLRARVEAANGSPNSDSYWARIVEKSDGLGGAIADWYAIDFGHVGNGVIEDRDWLGSSYFEFDNVTRQPSSPTRTANWDLVPGDYTLRIHMREDGTVIDKLVLQTSRSRPRGLGPPESAIVSRITMLQAGDADQDLVFDQLDLVQVQVAAKYLSGQPATWGEGDWNGAPGGSPGNPPVGDGLFNQFDIIAAQQAATYLNGPYAALQPGGTIADGQTSLIYNAGTGDLTVDAPAGIELTSINIDSAAGIFTGEVAANLGGSFDNDADTNIFKATFGGSFGSVSFGNVAQAGLTEEFVLGDLSVVGSLAGGGDLGNVDLVHVPEPTSAMLLAIGLVIGIGRLGRAQH